jgi:hypothetical protein
MKHVVALLMAVAWIVPSVNGQVVITEKAEPAAMRAYELLKSLEGEWEGTSTKGWKERVSFRVIAGESCVVSTSFDAHPNETMMTMYHMNGDELMLTHYCVARNQPRLTASDISPDLKTITFTFRDATNLASRDRGHMDKAVFRFVDADHFSSQWTWYQDGTERWMEEIRYVRMGAKTAATSNAGVLPAGAACHR